MPYFAYTDTEIFYSLSLTRLYCVSFFGDITHFFFLNLFAKIVDIKNEKKFQNFWLSFNLVKKSSHYFLFSSFKFQLLESSKKWWKQLNNNKKIPMLCKARKLWIFNFFNFFFIQAILLNVFVLQHGFYEI